MENKMELENPIQDEHEFMLRRCLAISADAPMPDKVLAAYDGVRRAARMCGVPMDEKMVVLVAMEAGALPVAPAASFIDVASKFKDGDTIAVKFRSEWRYATYHTVNTAKKKVVASICDDAGTRREFAYISARPLSKAEMSQLGD
jgi:hypothetical protein